MKSDDELPVPITGQVDFNMTDQDMVAKIFQSIKPSDVQIEYTRKGTMGTHGFHHEVNGEVYLFGNKCRIKFLMKMRKV